MRQPPVAKYHGSIVKLTGDGVLVEFGLAVPSNCKKQMSSASADPHSAYGGSRRPLVPVDEI